MRTPAYKSEHEVQSNFIELLPLMRGLFPDTDCGYAIPNGGKRHIKTAVALKEEGVRPGVWDWCLPIPMILGGWACGGLYIEFKHGSNYLTGEQYNFGQQLTAKQLRGGFYCFAVAWNPFEALEAIEYFLRGNGGLWHGEKTQTEYKKKRAELLSACGGLRFGSENLF